jgi:hypothetical protein
MKYHSPSVIVKAKDPDPAILGEPCGGDIFGGRAQIKFIDRWYSDLS